jgi:hypothetical protein
MASMARQISRDPFGFDLRGLVRAISAPRAGHADGPDFLADEDLTSRAVASAGLAALVALPLLLLSSVLLAAPLAVPAAIGVCYLAVSHALSAHRLRRANLINSAILCGLVGWLIGFLLTGEGPLSHAGLIAALMAPVFAAAPAFARSLIARKAVSHPIAEPDLRNAALTRVACLEELTPMEQVLVLDRDATVLAASSAARKELCLLPDAFEHALAGLLSAGDAKRVLDTIARCRNEAAPIGLDLTFDTMKAEKPLVATLSPCGDGPVAMRLRERKAIDPTAADAEERTGARGSESARIIKPAAPACDIGEAVAFALRHSSGKAEAGRLRVTSAGDPGIAAACDRQVGRRIVHLLIVSALDGCEANDTVHIFSRRLKGVVLLRTTTSPRKRAIEIERSSEDRVDMAALQALVDGAGGTLVADRRNEEGVLSVRLPLAPMPVVVSSEAAR